MLLNEKTLKKKLNMIINSAQRVKKSSKRKNKRVSCSSRKKGKFKYSGQKEKLFLKTLESRKDTVIPGRESLKNTEEIYVFIGCHLLTQT